MTKAKKIGIGFIAIIVVLLSVSAWYFLAGRPSDSDYSTAIADVKKLQSDTTAISQALASMPPSLTTQEARDNFYEAVVSYHKYLDKLQASPIAQKGFGTKAEFDKQKTALVDYGKSIKNTAMSVMAYFTLEGSCGALRSDSSAELSETMMLDCSRGYRQADAAPDSAFKSQFLNPYKKAVQELVAVSLGVQGAEEQKTDKIAALQDDLYKLYRDVKVDYKLGTSPKEALKNLLSVLESQKNSLIR